MNWLDLVLVLALVWFVIAGTTAGVVREAVGLLAAVLAVTLAGLFYDALADDIRAMVDSERTATTVAFAAILGAVLGAGQIVSVLLKGPTNTLALGSLDRGLGLVFGLLKGLLVIQAVLLMFARFHLEGPVAVIDGSLLGPPLMRSLPFALALLPGEFREAANSFPAPLEG